MFLCPVPPASSTLFYLSIYLPRDESTEDTGGRSLIPEKTPHCSDLTLHFTLNLLNSNVFSTLQSTNKHMGQTVDFQLSTGVSMGGCSFLHVPTSNWLLVQAVTLPSVAKKASRWTKSLSAASWWILFVEGRLRRGISPSGDNQGKV